MRGPVRLFALLPSRGRFLLAGVLLALAMVPEAQAGFVAPYDPLRFSLFNSALSDGSVTNGEAIFVDGGQLLILLGPHNGIGIEESAYTDLTTISRAPGLFHFEYIYNSLDDPGFDAAGYILNGDYHEFAGIDNDSGAFSVPVVKGDLFGFRVTSSDTIGEPGVLTISHFSGPVPEPGEFWLTTIGLLAIVATMGRRAARRSRGGARSRTALLGVSAALLAGVTAHAQVQADFTGENITGELTFARVVNLRQQSQMLMAQRMTVKVAVGETQPKMPPPRLRPPMAASRTATILSAPVVAKGLAVNSAPALFGFNALSHLDQRLAASGNQFSIEPPSQSLAVGNGYVLEGVNNALQVYSASGSPVLSSVVASNQLFGLGPAIDWNTGIYGVYLTDMRVYFDQGIGRWFVVQRAQDNDAAGNPLLRSHLYVAVSRTSDPTADYFVYEMETTNAGHPGCPCIADYPQIGSDQHGFHIAYNEFNSYYQSFVDSAIMSVSKQALANGAQNPTAFRFILPFTTGYEFAIQPATTPPGASNFLGSGGVEYFVSSAARFMSSSGVALWAARNTSSLATPSPFLILSRVVIGTLPYTFPDFATQPTGPLPYGSQLVPPRDVAFLDGGDNRIQSLTYAGARLYLTLQTGLVDENQRWVVGGAYIVLSPILRNNVLSGAVLNQGYLMVNGNHLLRPSVAVNAKGRGAFAVTLTGGNWYPTAALIPFETFATPTAVEIAGLGVMPEDGFTGYPTFGGTGVARWGDYNGAVAASDGSIWLVAQYIGNFPRTTYANWNTYIMRKMP